MKTLVTVLTVCAIFAPITSSSALSKDQSPISVTIRTLHDPIKVGQPIQIEITVTNISKDDIAVQRPPFAEVNYAVHVHRSDGGLAQATPYGTNLTEPKSDSYAAMSFQSGVSVSALKPNESLKQSITANELFDMATPGQYLITVVRKDTGAESNTITVNVTK